MGNAWATKEEVAYPAGFCRALAGVVSEHHKEALSVSCRTPAFGGEPRALGELKASKVLVDREMKAIKARAAQRQPKGIALAPFVSEFDGVYNVVLRNRDVDMVRAWLDAKGSRLPSQCVKVR